MYHIFFLKKKSAPISLLHGQRGPERLEFLDFYSHVATIQDRELSVAQIYGLMQEEEQKLNPNILEEGNVVHKSMGLGDIIYRSTPVETVYYRKSLSGVEEYDMLNELGKTIVGKELADVILRNLNRDVKPFWVNAPTVAATYAELCSMQLSLSDII